MQVIHMNYELIPEILKHNALWCLWKSELRPNSKFTKIPYNPHTGGKAQSDNPLTFSNFDFARATYERGGYDGMGIGIFSPFAAIDLDNINDDSSKAQVAAEIVELMDTYTEYSPSGNGLRIIFTVPEGYAYNKDQYYINNQCEGREIYVSGSTNKYVTITGDAFGQSQVNERSSQLQQVCEKFMRRLPRKSMQNDTSALCTDKTPRERFDFGMAKDPHLSEYWNGTFQGTDESANDAALMARLLYWLECDVEVAIEYFMKSPYAQNKDSAHVKKLYRLDYLLRTAKNVMPTTTAGQDNAAYIMKCSTRRNLGEYVCATRGESSAEEIAESNILPADFSDAGNGEVFVKNIKGKLIFSDALGWLWWNGKRWERDEHKALALGLEFTDKMLLDAKSKYSAALHDEAEVKAVSVEEDREERSQKLDRYKRERQQSFAYLKHAQYSRNAMRIQSMLSLAKPYLAIKADKLDTDPFDLNTPAGIVDLKTGSIRCHDARAFCSQITACSPSTDGEDMWIAFLDTITCEDSSLKEFLQTVAGMSAVGRVFHESILIAYGGGRNGKSTYFNALSAVMGDYSGGIDVKTLTTDRQNKGASLATLRGKRLVVTGELEEHQRLSVSTIKQLASTDRITIEEKFKAPETIRQTHTLCLFTNHLPRVGSTDVGTWRRLTVIPFNATISSDTSVQNYAEELVEKAGGAILSWVIEGAVAFCRNNFKLNIPPAVKELTETYRAKEDWLSNFIFERCIKDTSGRVGAAELYSEYRSWAEATGDYCRRLSDFTAAMETAGYQSVHPKNKRTWIGLHLDLSQKFSDRYSVTG